MVALTPRNITLTSSLNVFDISPGSSDGATLSVEFQVFLQDGDEFKDVKRVILEKQEQLDLLVISIQQAKAPTDPVFKHRKETLKRSYDLMLKRVIESVKEGDGGAS